MDIAKHSFDVPQIKVWNLGDIHRGDEGCDVDLLYSIIDEIAKDPNSYWVSTGDILNVAARKGKHAAIYHSLPLEKEYELIRYEFADIKHKCLGIVSSNHHARVEKEMGLSLDKCVARELGIPFLGPLGRLKLTVMRTSYFMALHHGVGSSGSMRGGKALSLERMSRMLPGCDIYMQGHTHSFQHFINAAPYVDKKRDRVGKVDCHYVTTGHFLKWEDSYAAEMALEGMPLGAAVLTLHGDNQGVRKKVEVDLATK